MTNLMCSSPSRYLRRCVPLGSVGACLQRAVRVIAVWLAVTGASFAGDIQQTETDILFNGPIVAGDDLQVAEALSNRPLGTTVRLASDGGEAIAGIKMGHAIREAGANTQLDGECLSACVFAFVGGNERSLDRGRLGFHQVLDTDSGEPISPYHPIYFTVTQYVFRSGVDPTTFLQWMGFATPDEIYYPSNDDLCSAGFLTNCKGANE